MFEQNMVRSNVPLIRKIDKNAKPDRPLKESVEISLRHYLNQMEGQEIKELYNLILAEIETPMLDVIMQNTRGNQTKAAKILGINRGTLRKKLKQYGMS